MSAVTAEAAGEEVLAEVDLRLAGTLLAAVVVGGGLALAARTSATALLAVTAVAQLLFAGAWVFGTTMPGRRGALILAGLAAVAADVAVSVWPHGRLGPLLAVLGLAVPVMFVHQLLRGAARVQVVSSLSAVALLVLGEVALPAFAQLRHEFGTHRGATVATAAIAAVAGALAVGCLVDLVLAAPRFDAAVGRGLLGLVAAAGLGGSLGYLLLRKQPEFGTGRATFAGAALGVLAGLVAIAGAYIVTTTPPPVTALGRWLRPALSALLPIALLAPAAFLLSLAIRS